MRKLATLAGGLAGVLALIALLYVAVALFTFDARSYPQEDPYGEMAQSLIGYLRGTEEVLPKSLFTERERLHMADVYGLFAGGRRLAVGCAVAALVLAGMSVLLGGRTSLGMGLVLGTAFFVGIALGYGVTGLMLGFDSWFTRMHELVFTNDLWLLDPADSMLIRMLPLEFFVGAVKGILLRFAAFVALQVALGISLWRWKAKAPPVA